jgi:hypothetical protein
MMTNDVWYEAVDATTALTQGDIILACPIVRWASKPVSASGTPSDEFGTLQANIEFIKADVVVITQACDLEQHKVQNVILCPHVALNTYKQAWEIALRSKGHSPTARAWEKTCEDIKNGYSWNLSMLNESSTEDLPLEHRVVDFHDVFTLPRTFLETLLQKREDSRLRLRPPYREHLSQAFARFFMRVGLPAGIRKIW